MQTRATLADQLAILGMHLPAWPEDSRDSQSPGDWIREGQAYAEGIRLRRAQLQSAIAFDSSKGDQLVRTLQDAGGQSNWDLIVIRYLLSDLQGAAQDEKIEAAARMVAKEDRTAAQLLGAALDLAIRGLITSSVYAIKRLIEEHPMSNQEHFMICTYLATSIQAESSMVLTKSDFMFAKWLQIIKLYSETTRLLSIACEMLSSEKNQADLIDQLEIIGAHEAKAIAPEDSGENAAILRVKTRERRSNNRADGKPLLRTIHHLACTGGTVICKCLATMPDTALLSEVNPFNRSTRGFEPSNPLLLLEMSHRKLSISEIIEDFTNKISYAHEICRRDDVDLIIRDHSHTDFCTGTHPSLACPVIDYLASDFDLVSVVTVRNPLDSFLSLLSQGWEKQFSPSTLQEYSHRYLAFLDRYTSLPIFRYEDFCMNPEAFLASLCDTLDISFSAEFIHKFGSVRLSGDSGRTGTNLIELRQRREIPDGLRGEIKSSESYLELLDRLGYAPEATLG